MIDILLTVTSNHGSFSWIGQCRPKIEVLRDGYQTLTIPVSAKYKIEILAPGHEYFIPWEPSESPGMRIKGTFELKKGQKNNCSTRGQQRCPNPDPTLKINLRSNLYRKFLKIQLESQSLVNLPRHL